VELHVLRVFVDGEDRHGNPLGVVQDGASVPADERQPLAAELGYSETVFVDDADRGEIRIFTPGAEVDFAGHPSVGTAWLLECDTLRPPAGEVPVRRDGELTWIAGRPEWGPPFEHAELGSPEEVEAYEPPASGLSAVWAWEGDGAVRSRVFPVDIGIAEDEATGAAAVRLGALLGQELVIRQGEGSLIHVRPRGDGVVEVGGRVVLDSVIER
jgi:predicted PhzF superfamily epimerase YddE/YHI9